MIRAEIATEFIKVLQNVGIVAFPLLIISASIAAIVICTVFLVRQIVRQKKLRNHIILVELRGGKFHYYCFLLIIGFLIVYVAGQLLDSNGIEGRLLSTQLGLNKFVVNIMLLFVLFTLFAFGAVVGVLVWSRSAVVDRGIYTPIKYIEWYNIRDYIIDEDKSYVLLTSDKKTFLTTSGVTSVLKVSTNDLPKLQFILNKNKNKFAIEDDI